MKKTFLALLVVLPAVAAPPTISNILVAKKTHNNINIAWYMSPGGACEVIYGLSSGTYTYQSSSISSQVPYSGGPNVCQMNIGGFTPGATYYLLPTSRPALDTNTDNCNTVAMGCGTAEQVVTMDAMPAIHPEPPTPPTVPFKPTTEPDTTGYTIVPIGTDGSGNCAATGNVAAQTNWTGSVSTGDSLRAVMGKIWFKTRVQFAPGTDCYVRDIGQPGHSGVQLTRYSPNGGPNDWVIVETAPQSATDFPPFGSRTGPEYASKMAIMRAYTPQYPVDPNYTSGGWQGTYNGQLWECDSCGANHIWFRNMEWSHRFDTTLFPPNAADQVAFGQPFRATPPCDYTIIPPLTNANGPCDPSNPLVTPDHLVVDRIYMPHEPNGSKEMGCLSPGGTNWVVIGNYCDSEVQFAAMYPQATPGSTGPVIRVPFSYYQLNQFDNNPVGMQQIGTRTGYSTDIGHLQSGVINFHTGTGLGWQAGDLITLTATRADHTVWTQSGVYNETGNVTAYNSSTGAISVNVLDVNQDQGTSFNDWRLASGATVTFSGASLSSYTGQIMAWVDHTGVVVAYDAASGVTATCAPTNYCHTQSATPGTLVRSFIPVDGLLLLLGNFSGGSFVLGCCSVPQVGRASILTPWRPQAIYFNSGIGGWLENNHIEGVGQTLYNDAQGTTRDYLITRNFIHFGLEKMQYNPTWNGYGYSYRNAIETKECNYCQYEGNIIDGAAAFQNSGTGFYMAGSFVNLYSHGVTDIIARSNIFRHVATGVTCNSAGAPSPDSWPAVRYLIENNMFLDLDRDHYNNTRIYGGGYASGALQNNTCSDYVIRNNTVGLTHGNAPSVFVGALTDPNTVFGDGLQIRNNLIMMSTVGSVNNNSAIISYGGFSQGGPTMPPYPRMQETYVHNPGVSWADYLDTPYMAIRPNGTFVPQWDMGHNILMGAQAAGGISDVWNMTGWTDLDQAGVDAVAGHWPAATDKFVPGSTMAARMAGGGLTLSTSQLKNGNPLLYKVSATAYNATDVGANVDQVIAATGMVTGISVTPGATSIAFSYTAPDARACSVDTSPNGTTWTRFTDSGGARTRLLAATGLTASTAYQYRLMCYYDQKAVYEFQSNQITSGTVTTLASASVTVFTGFTLPAGATQVLVTLTPFTGSPTSATCSTSPCSITAPNGTYNRTVQPQTSGAVSVGQPRTSIITVAGVSSGSLFDSATGLFDSATGLFDSH